MTDMYIFRLREDMPSGFKQNEQFPELPAAHDFLKQYDGSTFESKEAFVKKLGEFPDYLTEHNVPEGDREVRRGIFVSEANIVSTYNNGPSEECYFGTLEERC